ncbi:MAG: ImmA/IrrE family metallo-endopeptidase [Clostridium sp.]|nr:ImmA/IrrE family metallo-endopeptidase [Clostridium sp.]
MTYKPNFKKAYILANEILVKSRIINAFPFSVTKLIKEISDVQCCSFKRAQKYNVDIEAFGSKSAILTEYLGRQIIFYNQLDIDERVRFSMLHEVGHYLLDHDMDTDNKELYERQEIETNFFAAQLLMPEQTLLELQSRGKTIDADFLITSFKVSKEAAEKRIGTLYKINPDFRSKDEKEFDDLILLKYKGFLDSIVPKQNQNNWFEDEYERQRERERWH